MFFLLVYCYMLYTSWASSVCLGSLVTRIDFRCTCQEKICNQAAKFCCQSFAVRAACKTVMLDTGKWIVSQMHLQVELSIFPAVIFPAFILILTLVFFGLSHFVSVHVFPSCRLLPRLLLKAGEIQTLAWSTKEHGFALDGLAFGVRAM